MLDKNKIYKVLKENNLSVLATAGLSGKSEAAIMAHCVKDNLKILMSTEESSRKMKNILVNNQVSLVVGGLKNDPSLQVDGKAIILEGEDKNEAIKFMLLVHPELKDYGIEDGVILEITPNWVRYVDYSQEPAAEEINL